MARIPIALQLYSIREACADDLPGTLKAVAEMGYEGVEFAGYHGYGADDLRMMLDELGLKAAGTHTSLASLLGDELEATVAFNLTLDNRYLIVPGLPVEYRESVAAWQRTAELFTGVSARLAPYGMMTGYHNHTHEFAPENGRVPFEVFFDNTPDGVIMQTDGGNAWEAGVDICPYLEQYPGRARTVHLKEYARAGGAPLIGDGDTDWQRFFALCETVGGTAWYIVEQEQYPVPPLEAVKRCLDNLKAMGK